MTTTFISVLIITYNQDKYIKQAINSVLSQEINANIEIFIGDDASTDSTGSILSQYKSKFPNKFKIISRTQNIGPTSNLCSLIKECNGEYIAILEGDDYWTDPYKLSKQLAFLNNENEKYIACTHRYKIVDQNDNLIEREYFGPGRPENGPYTLEQFQNYIYFGLISTLLIKNIFKKDKSKLDVIENTHRFVGDISLNLVLSLNGRINVLDLNMAAHRIIVEKDGENYKSTIAKKNQIYDRAVYLKKLEFYALEKYGINIRHADISNSNLAWSLVYFLRSPTYHNLTVLLYTYRQLSSKLSALIYLVCNINKLWWYLKRYISRNIIR